ncbi:MAG TPA: DNA polymerase III subunit delta [Candidatus Dojkabacteria bacterium]|nr:DNA polymerase III subunit delta [Candidatus Dojkabacteria bacterium]
MYKLYIGNETYLSLKRAHEDIKELLKNENLEYISLDAEETESSKIIDLLSSQSLFNLPRLIFLKRLYKNKDRENLIPYILEFLKNNTPDNIIIWEDQKVSSATKYVKFFKTTNTLVEVNKMYKPAFIKFANELSKEYGLDMSREVLTLLCTYSNYDTQRLENNIKKLYLLELNKKIEEEDVKNIIVDTLEDDIWKLLDEMNKTKGQPLKILERILSQRVDPKYIFPMIARNMRLITMTKYLLDHHYKYSEIASIVGVPPFTVKTLVEASDKYDWDKIMNKYEKLCNLDYEIKIGKIDPKLGLTLFCTTI